MLEFLLAVLVAIAITSGFFRVGKKHKWKAQDRAFHGSHKGWEIYISPYDRGVIALSANGKEVVLGDVTQPNTYPMTAIATVEVLKDGSSITSTDRGSQAAGALVGGAALGGIGLLIGGLSGTRRNKNIIHSLALKVVVEDRMKPVYIVYFFKARFKDGTDAHHKILKEPLDKLDRFHALMVTSLRKLGAAIAAPISVSDEIKKLWDLKVAGALTDHEYEAHKAALTSQPIRS